MTASIPSTATFNGTTYPSKLNSNKISIKIIPFMEFPITKFRKVIQINNLHVRSVES